MAGSVRELLEANVAARPAAVAVTGGGVSRTWSELADRARKIAETFAGAGVRPQQRVVYLGSNSLDYFDVLFAAGLADLIFVPLNWRLSFRELADIINDTRAPLVIVDERFHEVTEQIEPLLEHAPQIVSLTPHPTWRDLWQWVDEREPAVSLPDVPADHVAFQLYTSGTTGRPKGVMFANGTNVRTLLDDISVEWGFTEADVSMCCMPLFHMGGLAWALTGMARGARLVVADFEPRGIVDLCRDEGVTAAFFVPAMIKALLDVVDVERGLPQLRLVTYSGAPIGRSLLAAAMKTFDCGFLQLYGMTEATGAFAQLDPEDHHPDGPRSYLLGSAGRCYPWVEVRVVDPATLTDLPRGDIGEIWTRSAQNMVGYFERPDETAKALTRDGWLRTGDVGYLDDEGYIFLRDRHKDVIITGGENVYPAEVENVLAAHPAVAEVAVIGVPDPKWGETVTAVVVPAEGRTVDLADLKEFVRGQLAGFKCPTRLETVESLPRTATGKIRKDVIREPFWRGHERNIN